MMSRIFLIVTFIYAVIATPLDAQPEKKQSFSLSYYPATMHVITGEQSPYMHNNSNAGLNGVTVFEAVMGDYGYKAVGYDAYNYGAFEIAYKRILSRWFQFHIGVSCELNSKHWDLYDVPDGPREKRIMDYRINLLPGIDWIVLYGKYAKLWFSGQAGGEWIHRGMKYFDSSERNKQKFAWQLWFVYDQRISNSISFNLGMGYGTLGIFKLGVSYHF